MALKDWLYEQKRDNKVPPTSIFPENNSKENLAVVEVNELVDYESLSSKDTSNIHNHIFKNPKVAAYYQAQYEAVEYECKDHFDPDFTWAAAEEKKVVWKCDWRVTFWAYIMFTALDFDRYNIAQAVSDNMLNDLGLTTNDYNIGRTINLVCFLLSELPSQMISKKLGADRWIPTQLILWSIVSVCQVAMKNKAGFYVTRALIGLFQGGFICDTCLWMTYFYTAKELPFRLSLFYIANPLTSVISALLGFAVLRISTNALPHGWQWVFLIEGLFTLLIGVLSYFMMPASAVQTKAWFRPHGWFTDREEKIVVNRVLRDDPSKGDMNNREPVRFKELLKALFDYDLLPIYLIRFFADLCNSPVSAYLTLTLRHLGFNSFNTNLLTIPSNVLTIISMLIFGHLSEVFKSRALMLGSIPLWVGILLLPLRFWNGSQINVWPTYAILTLLLGYSPSWPVSIAWTSANSNSVRNRAVSSAVVNIFSQAAGIAGSNIYRSDDSPLYHRGNTNLIIISFIGVLVAIVSRQYYIFRNNQKTKQWNELTAQEQQGYINSTSDHSTKRLDFRFSY